MNVQVLGLAPANIVDACHNPAEYTATDSKQACMGYEMIKEAIDDRTV